MRRGTFLTLVPMALVVTWVGCGTFPDFLLAEGARDGGPTPETPDASPLVPEGDARPDGGEAGAPLGFCEAAARETVPPAFCDDFDEPDRVAMNESGWARSGGLDVTLTDASFSPPRGALLDLRGDGGLQRGGAKRILQLAPGQTRLVWSFRVKPSPSLEATGTSVQPLVRIDWSGLACFELTFPLNRNASHRCNNSDVGSLFPGLVLETNKWNAVRIALERDLARNVVVVVVTNGSGIPSAPRDLLGTKDAGAEDSMAVGLYLGGNSASFRYQGGTGTAEFDDVRVDIE